MTLHSRKHGTERTEEATQTQLKAMDAPVPLTQVDNFGEKENKSIKSDTPPNRPPRDPTRCQRCSNKQHQRGQRCPALAECAKPEKQMSMKYKGTSTTKVHNVAKTQYIFPVMTQYTVFS